MSKETTHCTGCNCITYSIRKGRAHFVCDKCGHNKTLGDVYQYQLKQKQKEGKNETKIL